MSDHPTDKVGLDPIWNLFKQGAGREHNCAWNINDADKRMKQNQRWQWCGDPQSLIRKAQNRADGASAQMKTNI